MKVAYKHLANCIPSRPSIDDISEKLFQLGHEHEVHNEIFDMDLTPNRGDCLSLNGLLRDLAAFYEVDINNDIYSFNINKLDIDFDNRATSDCSHISFLKIEIAEDVRPYKGFLRDYFKDLGHNKNNFFTDVSNYISYETGQPTHCYDALKILNPIILHTLDTKQEFETLLGTNIELEKDSLVFSSNKKIINFAGIMGSKDSACSSDTRSVIVECAYFNPESIIGKSIKYNLKSDASYKFERGTDPLSHETVLRRFLQIVSDHARVESSEIFFKNYQKHIINEIPISVERANKILGTSLNKEEFSDHLKKLGFILKTNKIIVPSYRRDITNENDIAEEIARVIGYNNISSKTFSIPKVENFNQEDSDLESNIKKLLINQGFLEVINNPFVASGKTDSIKVDNPLDSNRQYLRNGLETSLLDNLLYNERRQKDSIKFFEISNIYVKNQEIQNKKVLGIICSGRVGKNYQEFSKKIDIKFLTNLFKEFFPETKIEPYYLSRENLDSKLDNRIVYLEIELDAFKKYDINYFEKLLEPTKLSKDNFIKYKPISEYPSSFRDLSFSVKDVEKYYELQEHLLNYKDELLRETFVFDYFINKKNNEIKIGFRFIFQSNKCTVTEKNVNHVMNAIIESSLQIDSVALPGYK